MAASTRSDNPPQRSAQQPAATPNQARACRRWTSAELLGAAQEIEIEHGPALYRLRLTSLGKLILTK